MLSLDQEILNALFFIQILLILVIVFVIIVPIDMEKTGVNLFKILYNIFMK